MTSKIELGATSLLGGVAPKVTEAFAGAKYPLDVLVTNHMPRDVVFPEVDGLLLRHCASATGTAAAVTLLNEAQFVRLASSITQIAELNGYQRAITIESLAPDPVAASATSRKEK